MSSPDTSPEGLARTIAQLATDRVALNDQVKIVTEQIQAVQRQNADLARDLQSRSFGESESQIRRYGVEVPASARAMDPKIPIVRVGERGVVMQTADGRGVRLRGAKQANGLLDARPRTDWQAELQGAVRRQTLARTYLRASEPEQRPETPMLDEHVRELCEAAPEWMRSNLLTTLTGQGGELIPTTILPEIAAPNVQASTIMGWFEQRQAPAVGNTISQPYWGGLMRPYGESIATIDDPASVGKSKPPTTKRDFALVAYSIAAQVDRYAVEDMIIDMLPELESLMNLSLEMGIADTRINGDTGGAAGIDSGFATWNPRGMWTPATASNGTDHRLQEQGFRSEAVGSGAVLDMGALQTYAGIRQLVGKMGATSQARYSASGGLVFAASVGWALKTLLGLAEVATLEKITNPANMVGFAGFGLPAGSSTPGLVGAIGGNPVVLDPFMTEDLAATGRYTGTGATSGLLVIDRAAYVTWKKPSYTLERMESPMNNQRYLIARRRQITVGRRAASEKTVAYGFNLS